MYNKKLEQYGYSNKIIKIIQPIIDLFDKNNIKEAEKEIAELALKTCNAIETNIMDIQEGDDCFTLINLYIGDNYPKLVLSKDTKDIVFEGMLLHDYGKDYGADIRLMRELANKILEEGNNKWYSTNNKICL